MTKCQFAPGQWARRALRLALACLASLALGAHARAQSDENPLRVMTFNIWVGGESGGQPLQQTAEVIRAANADIVGMQESLGRERDGVRPDNGAAIAELLGWNHVRQAGGRCILSRFEIAGLLPGGEGAEIALPSGESFYLFNVHLNHAPYQPYQLLDIPYADAPFLDTAEELIAAALEARGGEIARALEGIAPLLERGARVALTGDFNEPSHLDWTHRAVRAGVAPMAVAYPSAKAVVDHGMIDAYRAVHTDETNAHGFTWTPTTAIDDPGDRHDRIDMVFVSPDIAITDCRIVGEDPRYADVVVTPYPSDHRAVVVDMRLEEAALAPSAR